MRPLFRPARRRDSLHLSLRLLDVRAAGRRRDQALRVAEARGIRQASALIQAASRSLSAILRKSEIRDDDDISMARSCPDGFMYLPVVSSHGQRVGKEWILRFCPISLSLEVLNLRHVKIPTFLSSLSILIASAIPFS